MSAFLAKLAMIGAAIGSGCFLRSSGLLTKQDAKAASRFVEYGTLPSLTLQTFLMYGFLWWEGPAMGFIAFLASILCCLLTWITSKARPPSGKYLLAAYSASIGVGSIALAFVEAAFGAVGLHMAMLWGVGSTLANCWVMYFMLASGGTKVPEQYTHMDGGIYRGHWRGGRKEGLGVYTYPSGARYEGQWRDNLKHGLGSYHFPKGGWYEGEWQDGQRYGSGLRIKSSGAVQAGTWQGLELVAERNPEELGFLSRAVRETATAAQRVILRGNQAADLILQLLKQPVLWATAIAAILTIANYQIPIVVDFVTAHLAAAHIPLALLVFGLQLDANFPSRQQAIESVPCLASRFLMPLLLAAIAALSLSHRYTDAIAIAALCSLGPISEQAAYYTQIFQLNEVIGNQNLSCGRIVSISALTAATLGLLLATPPYAALSRTGLAISLGTVIAVLASAGSVAAWMLSRPSKTPKSTTSELRPSIASGTSPTSNPPQLSAIPIGIAWQEMQAEAEAQGSPEVNRQVPESLAKELGSTVELSDLSTQYGQDAAASRTDESGEGVSGSVTAESELDFQMIANDFGKTGPDSPHVSSTDASSSSDLTARPPKGMDKSGGPSQGRRRRRRDQERLESFRSVSTSTTTVTQKHTFLRRQRMVSCQSHGVSFICQNSKHRHMPSSRILHHALPSSRCYTRYCRYSF